MTKVQEIVAGIMVREGDLLIKTVKLNCTLASHLSFGSSKGYLPLQT